MEAKILALLEEQKGAVAELSKTVDERIKNATKGHVDSMLEEKMKKLNEALDGVTQKYTEIKALEAQFARASTHDDKGKPIPADAKEMKEAWTQFIRHGEGADDKGSWNKRNCKTLAKAIETKSMSIISDQDGGYAVLPDFSGQMISKIFETSPVRQVADVITVGGPEISGLYDNDEASCGWVNETGARNVTNTPKLGRWTMGIYTVYAMPTMTQDLIDDNEFDLENWLANKAADKIARTENAAFVNGSGVGQPRGFLTYAAGTNLPLAGAQGQIQQIISGAATGFTYAGLINLTFALKDQYRGNGVFTGSRATIGALRGLVDSFGRPLWGEVNLVTGQPSNLIGYPFKEFNDMPAPGASALSLAFADWKQFYTIADRKGIRILRDPYTSKPNVLYYTTKRVGGQVLNFEAGALQICST
jgi:HK97 family phage major capsid protein